MNALLRAEGSLRRLSPTDINTSVRVNIGDSLAGTENDYWR